MGLRLPPDYVNAKMGVLLSRVSDGAWREYCRLRAVSWGKDVVAFSFEEYEHLFGCENVSESTFYRRLSELRTSGVLRYSSSRNSITGARFFDVTFSILGIENDLLNASALFDSDSVIDSESGEKSRSREGGVGGDVLSSENCEQVLLSMTGWVALPKQAKVTNMIPVLQAYYEQASGDLDVMGALLMPYLDAWRAAGYRATNLDWLMDWAAVGEVPLAVVSKDARSGSGDGQVYSDWVGGE